LTVITHAGRAIVRPIIRVRFAAWKAECRTYIDITASLRILPTATWRLGAAEIGVLEPGPATVTLTAIGIETVIGIGIATGIVTEMTIVTDIMTTGGIAGGTSTITTATMTMTKITSMTTTAKSK